MSLSMKYVYSFTDSRGKLRHVFRRSGYPKVTIKGDVGSQEFMANYHELLERTNKQPVAPSQIVKQEEAPAPGAVVYFVQIGKFVKIGFTTNLKSRIKSFKTSTAETITVLKTFPGSYRMEARLHDLFREQRVRNEFFHFDYYIDVFLRNTSLESALKQLDGIKADERLRKSNYAEWRAKRNAERLARLERDGERDRADIARRIEVRGDVKPRTDTYSLVRRTKAEKNAYFASLVAERKQRIGW